MLTRGVGAAPALGQAQRVASPGGGGLVVGEARRGPGGGRGAAWPLGDFPQLVGQRHLALGDGPRGPGGLHVVQFTFLRTKHREENKQRNQRRVKSERNS